MKSKNFKFVLPAFAILFAISLSFATEANSDNQTGYYNHPILGIQPVPGGVDCQTQVSDDCTYLGYPVFADPSLSIPLYKTQ